MRILRLAVGLGCAAIALAVGCLIPPDDLVDRACKNDGECPDGYLCQELSNGARGCRLQFPLPVDSGTVQPPYTGPTLYYCSDIKPILDFYCVQCHGPDEQNGGDFRLDYYDQPDGGRGAHAMATEIKYRAALAKTMPPLDDPEVQFFPTDQERLKLYQWVDGGVRECAPPDGGTLDGGTDGGGVIVPKDGGYYLTQIQPIFNTYCSNCHSWTYGTLVGVAANCNTGTAKVRIAPGDAGGSLLYLKITNDPALCGNSMPRGQQPLSVQNPTATLKIRDWINTGADAN